MNRIGIYVFIICCARFALADDSPQSLVKQDQLRHRNQVFDQKFKTLNDKVSTSNAKIVQLNKFFSVFVQFFKTVNGKIQVFKDLITNLQQSLEQKQQIVYSILQFIHFFINSSTISVVIITWASLKVLKDQDNEEQNNQQSREQL